MESDEHRVGSLLSRREVLTLGISTGAFLAVSTRTPAACFVRPEQTPGPYFVDERLNRSDVRSDPSNGTVKAGTPLALAFAVSRLASGDCRPLAGAHVELWHCDAQGIYSDVIDPNFNTKGQKFLRGYQTTNESGVATFATIYPGWYPGRAVHIHFTIRTEPLGTHGHAFTSQIYFDDALTDRVHKASPYVKPGTRVRNEDDQIFRNGGQQLILSVTPTSAGYAGTFNVSPNMR
jgi:protocatechuate 3,4-dioxygenase beta subunit